MFYDFAKAFDSISWEYMEMFLKKLGFGNKVINFIKNCNNHPCSMYVNGFFSEWFKKGRGVPQGEVYSPLLFILLIEAIARMFQKEDKHYGIKPTPVSTSNKISFSR